MTAKKGDLSIALDLEAMKQDAPVNTVLNNFMIPSGPGLELLTRTTPNLARAGEICMIYGTMFKQEDGSFSYNADGTTQPKVYGTMVCFGNKEGDTMGIPYMRDFSAQLMRFAVSMDGKGREEQIAALQAGGKLPDSYFDHGSSTFEVKD